jgi:TatA/E family protein of Tat protein translocase
MFGNIGFPELMVILVIALLVFGPKKLPEVGQSVGKAIREFRKATEGIKSKIEDEISASEIKSVKDDIQSVKTEIQGVKENITKDVVKQEGEQEKKAS